MSATLLVLAAGMGSRYGGLKQLDPVGPGDEVVLDYSVHDAVWAGFDRVVFVIRPEFEDEFRRLVISRYEGSVPMEVVFQQVEELPDGFQVPAGREKPWGTGHAIWCARHAIHTPFLVVNADDFYGAEAFLAMSSFLGGTSSGTAGLRMAMVAYRLANTLSENGAVARGVCEVSRDGLLNFVEECTGIAEDASGRIVGTDTCGVQRVLTGEEPVSMNFWGFTPEIFFHLGRLFTDFLNSGGIENPKSEFYIPSAVTSVLASGEAPASVLPTSARWFGVTFKEDREHVAIELKNLTAQGLYKSPLWKHTK